MVLPPIVVAIIWKVIYTPDISPIHRHHPSARLARAGADHRSQLGADGDHHRRHLGMVPLHHADGAGGAADDAGGAHRRRAGRRRLAWQLIRYVTLPFIQGVLLVAGLFRLIDSIKAFPLIYILTDGGPGTLTEVTNYYAFLQAFNFCFWATPAPSPWCCVAFTLC